MGIDTIGEAVAWYTDHCRGLDDWDKTVMQQIWHARETDEEKIELARSILYAKEQLSMAHQFQEQVDRIVKQEDAHKFVQIISLEYMHELVALDARGKVWYWYSMAPEGNGEHNGYWKQYNPERVPYGLKKK